jgi:hypothetical protein
LLFLFVFQNLICLVLMSYPFKKIFSICLPFGKAAVTSSSTLPNARGS